MGALAGVPQQTYGEQEIENGLQALAVHAGNARVASEMTGVPERTLRNWRNQSHVERYAEIRREIMPKIRQRLAAMHEDNAAMALEKAREAMAGLDPDKLSHSEKAKATQQLAVASGVYTDKASILRGLPSAIEEHATAEEIIRRFRGVSTEYAIPGTGEEITDAEVVEEPRAVGRERPSQPASI